jgi:hypothetical protein
MIEEIHLFGVFMPAPLLWALVAAAIAFPLRRIVERVPVLNWHPHLADLTLFMLLWVAIALLADRYGGLLEVM